MKSSHFLFDEKLHPEIYQAFEEALNLKAQMIVGMTSSEFVFFVTGTVFNKTFMEDSEDCYKRGFMKREMSKRSVVACLFLLVIESEWKDVDNADGN